VVDNTTFIQGGGRGLGLAFVDCLLAADTDNRVIASARNPQTSPDLHRLRETYGRDRLQLVALDIGDENSVRTARQQTADLTDRLDLMISCAGLLHDDHGLWPEKQLADIDADNLARSFAVNATGPLLMIKHFHDLLSHGERAVIASLSARVGSISDNRLGGWYAYRAAKAAQNQFTRTAAIELRRKSRALICVGLHPGTVDTRLSEPFQRRVPDKQLQSAEQAARHLLDVIGQLSPQDSGHLFDWAGSKIEP